MAKRKRGKHASTGSRAAVGKAANGPVEGNRPNRRQAPLLLLAVALLGGAIWLNIRRVSEEVAPAPLPLPSNEVSTQPLRKFPVPAGPRFTALSAEETGIDFTHPVIPDHPLAFLYFSGTAAGGIAVGDVDGDERPDIYVVSGPNKNRLYRQTETPFDFEDITDISGVDGGEAWGCGATMVDINGDGRLDIYVTNYDSANLLYVNRGDGSFVERAAMYGLNITDASMEGVFADYDRDGDLDMYLLTYRYENPDGMPARPPLVTVDGKPVVLPEFRRYYVPSDDEIGYAIVGRADGLLRNDGDAFFANVSFDAGIFGTEHGQSATWWDYDADGYPDLYVGNDFNDPDHLYHNNGDGTFTDVIADSVPHTTWFSMGSDAADLNGDGRIDLLASDMSSTTHFKQKTTMGSMSVNRRFLETAVPRQYMRNALLLNTGTNRFAEAAYLAGLDSTDWTWAVKLLDLDCDGREDVFITNGSVRTFTDSDRTLPLSERVGKTEWDLYKDAPALRERNLAFRNHGQLSFQSVAQDWGLDHLGVSMAAAHADLDLDGDPDLIVGNVDEPLTIYRNNSNPNAVAVIQLAARDENRFGIGARVTARAGQQVQVKELFPSRGFLGCNEPALHFAFAEATRQIDQLTVQWPSGLRQDLEGLELGKQYTLLEPDTKPETDVTSSHEDASTPAFTAVATPDLLRHVENEFDDYALQPLLPFRMSQLGPGIAAADIDLDGDTDFFLGGAKGQPGRVVTVANGEFKLSPQPALVADRDAEDMGAVWLDVESDGDLDLFVLSGGNEVNADSPLLAPRLYLNDGDGQLERAPADSLPPIRVSGGPVAAADYDRDGDVDLFLGGRQMPGKYPLPASSYLLINEDGSFRDGTTQLAPALREIGMVTGALWTDCDDDGSLDLLLSKEWGTLQQLRNVDGRLVDRTAESGLSAYRGWWTGISGADFDADGDIDYVVTNLGLNTKYHASDEHPFQIYYGDFEGNGSAQLVEAEYEQETLFPVRGKSCSTNAIPTLANKFTTYKDFAAASLQEIYTPECLEESFQCSANTLSTALLINDGDGNFEFRWLPRAAQIAPSFGVVVSDLTGDGHADIFFAHNFFSPQPETGNFDGGLGLLLQGNGDGTFRPLDAKASGIVLPGDAKAAVVIDLDQDGRPDLVVATNNGPLRAFSGTQSSGGSLCVRFEGVGSTAELAGTKLTARRGQQPPQICEFHAGSGYLSQQPPIAFFGSPDSGEDREPWSVTVVWPSGKSDSFELQAADGVFTIPK